MNTKSSWVILALVLLSILFVPLVPNDVGIECDDSAGVSESCDQAAGYVSIYTKYFGK